MGSYNQSQPSYGGGQGAKSQLPRQPFYGGGAGAKNSYAQQPDYGNDMQFQRRSWTPSGGAPMQDSDRAYAGGSEGFYNNQQRQVGGYGQAPATGERQPRSFSGRMPVEPYFNPAQGWQAQNLPGQPNNPNAYPGFVNAGPGGPPLNQGELPVARFQQIPSQASIGGMTKPAMLGAGGPPPNAGNNLQFNGGPPPNTRPYVGAGSGGPPPNQGELPVARFQQMGQQGNGTNSGADMWNYTDPEAYVRNNNVQFDSANVGNGVVNLRDRYQRHVANNPTMAMDMMGNVQPRNRFGQGEQIYDPTNGPSYAWVGGSNAMRQARGL